MKKEDFELKAWGGQKAHVIAKCKYCKAFSMAEVMMVDPVDQKPYHPQCKEKYEREKADATQNLGETPDMNDTGEQEVTMPGFDGTGPDGRGPMTGGQRGLCEGARPRRGFGRGLGRGRGRRRGRRLGLRRRLRIRGV